MTTEEIRNMRLRQMIVSNVIMIAILTIFISSVKIFTISFGIFYFIVALLMLLQTIFRFTKKDATKSFIPIYEKVAVYEKEKLGEEWHKQQKSGKVISVILSAIFILNALLNWESTKNFSDIDALLIFILCFFVFIVLNIGMIVNIYKIDRTNSQKDLKGYTLKSHLMGVLIGVLLTFGILGIIIFYAIATI